MPVTAAWLSELLMAPYSPQGKQPRFTDQHKIQYQDIRVRHDMWEKIHQVFPRDDWTRAVNEAYAKALAITEGETRNAMGGVAAQRSAAHIKSVAAVILVPGKR